VGGNFTQGVSSPFLSGKPLETVGDVAGRPIHRAKAPGLMRNVKIWMRLSGASLISFGASLAERRTTDF
jgi:hypothetical protein